MPPLNVIQSENISDSLTRCWRVLRNDDIQWMMKSDTPNAFSFWIIVLWSTWSKALALADDDNDDNQPSIKDTSQLQASQWNRILSDTVYKPPLITGVLYKSGFVTADVQHISEHTSKYMSNIIQICDITSVSYTHLTLPTKRIV